MKFVIEVEKWSESPLSATAIAYWIREGVEDGVVGEHLDLDTLSVTPVYI